MTNKVAIVLAVAALVIAVLAYVGTHKDKGLFGAVDCQTTTCLSGGLRITSGVLEADGGLTVPTTNTATSTTSLGCIQTTATSTATPWKLVVVASSTQIAPGFDGYVLAKYGTCP